jgi:hypothetical protein
MIAFHAKHAVQCSGTGADMRAEVRQVSANDIPCWPDWVPADAVDELQWFSVAIGPAGSTGADLFQVALATALLVIC